MEPDGIVVEKVTFPTLNRESDVSEAGDVGDSVAFSSDPETRKSVRSQKWMRPSLCGPLPGRSGVATHVRTCGIVNKLTT